MWLKANHVGFSSILHNDDDDMTRKGLPHLHFLFGLMVPISFYAVAYSIPLPILRHVNVPLVHRSQRWACSVEETCKMIVTLSVLNQDKVGYLHRSLQIQNKSITDSKLHSIVTYQHLQAADALIEPMQVKTWNPINTKMKQNNAQKRK